MSITSRRAENRTYEIEYPMLMELKVSDKLVVLFTDKRTGIEVCGDDVGHFSETWNHDLFTPYHGEVKLRNS